MEKAKPLVLSKFIEELQKEDPDAVVAIENNGYLCNTTKLLQEGWLAGTFYMKKSERSQNKYIMKDEIPADNEKDYDKVIVLCALVN